MSTDSSKACRSQCQQILQYMKEGNRINPQKALQKFGCLRLAARIADIEKIVPVKHEMVYYNSDRGTRKYMEYYLDGMDVEKA